MTGGPGGRIGVLTHNVDRGGVQRVSIVEARELARRGYESRLHSIVAPADPWRELLDGVEYDCAIPYESRVSEAVTRLCGNLVGPRFDADVNVCHNLPGAQLGHREHARNGTPYVVYMHDSGIYPVTGNPLGELFHYAGTDGVAGRVLRRVADGYERRWLTDAERVLVNSRRTKRDLESKFGFETAYLYPTTVPDLDEPGVQREDFFLVVQQMYAHPTWELVRELLDRVEGMEVVFAGKKASEGRYRKIRERFRPYEERVTFVTDPSDRELGRLYNRALAYLDPGHENFNMSALEAASTGCPVIVPRDAGVTDLFGDYPLFCPEADVDALAERVRKLLSSPAFRAEMGALARSTAERWDTEYHVDELLEVLECANC